MPRSVGNKLSEEFLAMRKIFIALFVILISVKVIHFNNFRVYL